MDAGAASTPPDAQAVSSKLLVRQLRRTLGVEDSAALARLLQLLERAGGEDPELQRFAQGFGRFVSSVDDAYEQFERDLVLRTRSLEVSSEELTWANEQLRQESQSQQRALETLRSVADEIMGEHGLAHGSGAEDLLALAQLMRDLVHQRERAQRRLARNEERFRSLLEHLPGCVYRSAPNRRGTLLFISQGVELLTGYTPASFMNDEIGLSDLVDPDDLQRVYEAIDAAFGQRRQFEVEYRLRHANGTRRWVHAVGKGVFDDTGKLLYLDGMILDITATRVAELEAARVREQLERAVAALDLGFAMFDAEQKLVICNHGFVQFYPEVAHLIQPGMAYADFLRAIYRSGMKGIQREIPEDVWVESRSRAHREGQSREVEIDQRWIRFDDTHTPDGLIVSLRTDVTDVKRLQQRLIQARDAAEAANKAKSEFLANMSHEIRTPMNGIVGMTALALNTRLSREQAEYLGMVKSSADSLLAVINDILDFSKMEAGMLAMENIPFSLHKMLADCIRPLGVRAFGKKLELMYRVRPEVPDSLMGDPGRLRQVITNLVGNAIKFTEHGEVVVEVGLGADTTPGKVQLQVLVRDTGIGIPRDKQEHVFEAFSQADASVTRRYGGTGLGLAICTRLVRIMHGRIWLESQPGDTRFHFEVTLNRAPADVAPALSTGPLAGRTVLLVEGNRTLREWLGAQLQAWGMAVTLADSGGAAFGLLRDQSLRYDVLLLDARMPGVNGFDVVRALPADQSLDKVVMMLPPDGLLDMVARCKEHGLAHHLAKPLSPSSLLGEVLNVVGSAAPDPEAVARAPQLMPAARRLRILLAEDNPTNQALGLIVLQHMGHQVEVANNGIDAVRMVSEQSFDLVLMDVQMPRMDGFTATTEIRAREQRVGGHVPVIALTANAMTGDRARCLQVGMDGYVSKPIDNMLLAREIERVTAATRREPPDLDMDEVVKRTGVDQEFALEQVEMFGEQAVSLARQIHESAARGDMVALATCARRLSGLATICSARAIGEIADALVKSANAQPQEVAALLPRLDDKLARLGRRLRELRERPLSVADGLTH